MRRLISFLVIIAIIAFGVAVAVLLFFTRPTPETEPYISEGPLVITRSVSPEDVTMTVDGFGTAEATKSVTLTAEVSGQVVHVSPNMKEGGFFREGDLLLEIDPRTYQFRVENLEASVEKIQAELAALQQQTENAKKDLELASEEVDLAQSELKRQQDLRESNVTSESALEKARLSYLQSRSKKQSVENQIATLKPNIEAAKAGLKMTKAQLGEARLNLSRTQIKAPFRGRAARKMVEKGQFVNMGTPLAEIYDVDSMEVNVKLALDDIRWLDFSALSEAGGDTSSVDYQEEPEGPLATALLDTGNEIYRWNGRIVRVGGVIDEATRTLPVVVKISDPLNSEGTENALPLLPGTFVSVEIQGRNYSDIIVVPRSAIRSDNTVYVAENGLLRIKDVSILRRTGEEACIDRGLKKGDNVIISPVIAVTDNMKIRQKGAGE